MDSELFGRIVRIEASFAGCDPKVGTGFRLAPGRVLTSQHVVEREGSTAESIFVSRDAAGDGQIERKPATVIWRGERTLDLEDHRSLDAALLEDELSAEGLKPFQRLVRLPQPGGTFVGAGFVKVSGSSRELHRPDGMEGHFDPVQDFATSVSLRIEGAFPTNKAGEAAWGGISGSPIFIGPQGGCLAGFLYGVVRRTVGSFSDRVTAVASTVLLRNPEFCAALGIEDPPPPHERLVVASRDLLEKNPQLARRLAAMDSPWKQAWKDKGTEGLLEAVCREGDMETLLDGLLVLAKASKSEPGELASLRESAVHLVALLAHHEFSRRAGVAETAPGRFRVPVTSLNYAEAVFASSVGLKARYAKPTSESRGRQSLAARELEVPTTQLESGLESRNLVADQVEEMAATFLEGLDMAPYLYDEQQQIIKGEGPERRIEVLGKAVEHNLRRLAKRKGRQPFLFLTAERKKPGGFATEAFLRHLQNVLPSLIYLDLEGDALEALELEEKLRPLWEILGIEST